MSETHHHGPHHLPALEAKLERAADGQLELRSPGVGLWRDAPGLGAVVTPGAVIGRLEVLGRMRLVHAPAGAAGRVVMDAGAERARLPVGFDSPLMRLDPSATSLAADAGPGQAAAAGEGGLVFKAPSSGRFYAKPGPDKPPFVTAGDEIQKGQTVAILEVMKTFNRIAYGGPGMPERARVLRVVPADGDDLDRGGALLELEALD